jgi:hypothetical protein
MADAAEEILAIELRKNDRDLTDAQGRVVGTLEKYILQVLPKDITAAIRAVAMTELNEQVALDNKPSQIIVDNLPASKRSIERACRSVKLRFQDSTAIVAAVNEAYQLLQQITRIQRPPKNNLVARTQFFLWLNGVNLGQMPAALVKISMPGMLTPDSIVRIVGPLVPYGRKLFWNPVGASTKMSFRRVNSQKSKLGVRFLPMRGASKLTPQFKPWSPRTLRRKAANTDALKAMMSGATPPGRIENTGEIVARLMKRAAAYRGLHFSTGWVEYPAAIAWSALRDPRVPSFAVQMSKKGQLL